MSSLVRCQLRELLPSLSSKAKAISDPDCKSKFKILKIIAESNKSIELLCAEIGKSHQWFYKWANILLKRKDILSLKSRSRKPNRSPKQTPKRVAKRIRKLREYEPFSGPERISRDLKTHYNIQCPPSTVYANLKREKLISQEHSKKLTKKHLKRYRRPLPGWLQMDFKYVPYLINGNQYYQLSCVDHHSSWRFIRCYPEKSEMYVIRFLKDLERECPFPIFQLQTDNDAAFTDKFTSQMDRPSGEHKVDLWCETLGIAHKLIPVGEKEINGKVENTHKFDDREFFSQVTCQSYEALDVHSRFYNIRWNERRATKTLGWLTPNEVLLQSYVTAYAYMSLMQEKYCPQPIVAQVSLETIRENIRARLSKKKIKKSSAVSRYLKYLDWEQKTDKARRRDV